MMSKSSNIILLLIAILYPLVGHAQVEWLEEEYDYGTFREAAGPQKGTVRFVNKGEEPTFINSVRPSCGCTAAAYTESMIQPGDTATVSFIYNPYGRPGKFDKTVKIFLGQENRMKIVRIKGTVIGEPETLKATYPFAAGPLRIEKTEVGAGELRKGSSRHLFVNVYNQSEDSISPRLSGNPRALEVELTPAKLAPGDIGTLGFYLRTPLEEQLGPVEYNVILTADTADPHSEQKELTITANILPNPYETDLTKSGKTGHIYVPQEFADLGEVTGDGIRKFRFEIINDGPKTLDIKRVYCLEESVRLDKAAGKIKPGKRKIIEGTVNPAKLSEGPFRLNVEILSSDSLNPVKTLRIVGIRKP